MDEKNCSIYCGNCLDRIEKIEDKSVDLVLTDIPYLISRKTNLRKIKNYTKKDGESKYNGMEYSFEQGTTEEDIQKYVKQCWRMLKEGGNLIIWTSYQQLGDIEALVVNSEAEQKISRCGEWIKTNPLPVNKDTRPVSAKEYFLCIPKGVNSTFNKIEYYNSMPNGKVRIMKKGDKNLLDLEIASDDMRKEYMFNEIYERLVYIEPTVSHKKGNLVKFHPTQKPLKIIKHLVEVFSNKEELVYDGMLGSGTTAQACKLLNRKFIGAEINKEYYDKIICRLRDSDE